MAEALPSSAADPASLAKLKDKRIDSLAAESLTPFSDPSGTPMSTMSTMSTPHSGLSDHQQDTQAMADLSTLLADKTWFGFSLDDTLHDYTNASARASAAVLDRIATVYNLPITTLEETLASARQQNFTDPSKSSTDYRKERFAAILTAHGVTPDVAALDDLVRTYKNSRYLHLTPKAGLYSLLRVLKAHNKKVIVIADGPRGSLEWTLEHLHLLNLVDVLVSSGEAGMSKEDGLFKVAIKENNIHEGELVYFGTSWEKDVKAAEAQGVMGVLVEEQAGRGVGKVDGRFRVGSLKDIRNSVQLEQTAGAKI